MPRRPHGVGTPAAARSPYPCANLLVFRTDGATDVGHVAAALRLDRRVAQVAVTEDARPWIVTSAGQVPRRSLRAHVDWQLENIIRPNLAALHDLRREGYWVSVVFHDCVAPDADERAQVDAELEALDITFDFEPERR